MTDTVDKLIIQSETRGVQQTTNEVQGLSKAMDGVSVASEKVERSTGSMDGKFASLERRLGTTAAQARQFEKDQKTINDAVAQNPSLSARAAEAQSALAARYTKAGAAAASAAKQTGLARHELVNLQRQAADVGVSLASGQSPLTVLVQQGSQIADVFASSRGTVSGFFLQATGLASRFATSTGGIVAGVAAITTGIAAMAASWSSAQRDIEKGLATAGGAASGLSRSGINSIAEKGSSLFGLSVSEAREAATAFASTGKIYEQAALRATLTTKLFADAMGIDASEATKKLAQDLQSPGAAASEWAKKISGIDADTVGYIRTLENMGKRQEAINALITAATPGLQKQAEQVGVLSKAYDFATNALSDWWNQQKKNAANVGDFVTGGNMFGSRTDEERLAQLQRRQGDLQSSRTPGLDAAALRAVTAEIDQLNKKLAETGEASQRFVNLSNEAEAVARGVNQAETQIEQLNAALRKLQDYQEQRKAKGLAPDPGTDEAIRKIDELNVKLIESDQIEKNRNRAVGELVMRYGEVTTATALALDKLQGQLHVAQQVTGAARMRAQAETDYNDLLTQGVSKIEAQKIAAEQLAVSQASASSSVQQQVQDLEDQTRLMKAHEGPQKARVTSEIAFEKAIRDGADQTSAAALRAATYANEMEKVRQAANGTNDQFQTSLQLLNSMQASVNQIAAGVTVVGAQTPLDWSETDAYIARNGHSQGSGGFFDTPSTMGQGNSNRSTFQLANPYITGGAHDSQLVSAEQWRDWFNEWRDRMARERLGTNYNDFRFANSAEDVRGASSVRANALKSSDNKADKLAGMQMDLEALLSLYPTQTRLAQIADLQREMERLRNSVDENTAALNKVTLNPLYTEGRSALKVGYMHAAKGLDFIAQGPTTGDQVPVHIKVNGGERVRVETKEQQAASNDNSRSTVVYNTINVVDTKSSSRRSARQVGQRYGQMMAALS